MKRKSILKQAVALTLALGISLSGSLVAYADEQRIMTETLDKMGGFVGYYDKTVGLYGYIDSYNNNEIAIPAQYYKINAFFNGFAIVRLSEYSSGDDVQNIYAFIDEAGSVLCTHEFFSFDGKSYSMVQPSFYNFVGDPDGYAYYVISYTRTSVEYSAVKYNGESVSQIFKEFAPIKNADGSYAFTKLGNFVNGSANVYVPLADNTFQGEFILLNKYKLIGSITSSGVFSTEINSESEFDKESINQVYYTAPDSEYEKLEALQSVQTIEGWVQDSTGWWYRNADGSYPVNEWKEINSNQYYFGTDGYMLYDTTTPDGYDVDINGVRTEYSFSDEDMIDALVDLYEGAFYVDEAAFEQDVKLFFPDTVEAEQIINEIRNNHTLVPYVPEF